MTWKQFKNEIDRELKEKRISEDTEISYIDVSGVEIKFATTHLETNDNNEKFIVIS